MPKPKQNKESAKQQQVEHEVDENETLSTNEENEVANVACPDVQLNRVSFRALTPDKEATQLMCFPKYLFDKTKPVTPESLDKNGQNFIIVTKPIKMIKGGIPRHNQKYHGPDPDSMKRAFFYIPRNESDPNSMELFNCIQRIDDYMDTEINKNGNEKGILSYLNSNNKKIKLKGLTYKRMITTAKPGTDFVEEDGEEEESPKKKNKSDKEKKEFVPWDRIKVKLSTLYDESLGPNDKREITTQVYIGNNDTPEKVTTVTGIESKFSWNCVAQFALHLNKVWIKKTEDKTCGFGIKCIQIGVTEPSEYKRNVSITKQLNKRLFASVSAPVDSNDNKGKNQKDNIKEKEEDNDEKEEDGNDEKEDDNKEEDSDDDEKEEDKSEPEEEEEDKSEPEEEEEEEEEEESSKKKTSQNDKSKDKDQKKKETVSKKKN